MEEGEWSGLVGTWTDRSERQRYIPPSKVVQWTDEVVLGGIGFAGEIRLLKSHLHLSRTITLLSPLLRDRIMYENILEDTTQFFFQPSTFHGMDRLLRNPS